MKKAQLKLLIKNIIKEAVTSEIFGMGKKPAGPKPTQQQQAVIDLLTKRGFAFEGMKTVPQSGTVVAALTRQYGKGRHGGPRYAFVFPDGKINQDKVDVNAFLKVVGESMSRPQDHRFDNGREEAPMGAVNIGENEDRPCDCGSGESSEWEHDGQGIPLVRACSKCRQKKLSRYRPEILRPYSQADVDEPIEPDDYQENISEESATGAVAGYATPYAFSKKKGKKEGSSRAIAAAKKYGTVVKSISEETK